MEGKVSAVDLCTMLDDSGPFFFVIWVWLCKKLLWLLKECSLAVVDGAIGGRANGFA